MQEKAFKNQLKIESSVRFTHMFLHAQMQKIPQNSIFPSPRIISLVEMLNLTKVFSILCFPHFVLYFPFSLRNFISSV